MTLTRKPLVARLAVNLADGKMNIGQAAQASGVSAKMIRYYEKIGLVRRADRSEGNYRQFGERDVADLRLIHHARRVGLPVEEILRLLALWRDADDLDDVTRQCAASQHLAALRQKSASLRVIMKALRPLAADRLSAATPVGRQARGIAHPCE